MEYPHSKFIKYLLTLRRTPYEIKAECVDKNLLPPTAEDVQKLSDELGEFPRPWSPSWKASKQSFQRWLKYKDVDKLWRQDSVTRACFHFLYRTPVRKDFEALILMHGNVKEARDILSSKHGENRIPDEETLDRFVEFFWNVGSLSADGLFSFLRANKERQDLIPAYQGDLATMYGRLGLQQRIEAESFYDNIIALANKQVLEARRRDGEMPGHALMGLAAITRQALDAIRLREEIHSDANASLLNSLRDQASSFKMKTIDENDIPTYDSIRLIDVGEDDDRNVG